MNSSKGESMATASATMPFTDARERLSELFNEHHRRVFVAAYRITGSMADAEDVTQAVFLRLAGGAELGMKNAGSYLYRAAINGALDLLRRRKIAVVEPLDAAAEVASKSCGPDSEISRDELREWLRQAISELPPRAAEMFMMRYLEGLGNREVARTMGTSQAVVAVTLHHARARLKKRLAELERGIR